MSLLDETANTPARGFPWPRGAVLNAVTVLVGALIGLAVGDRVSSQMGTTVMGGIGLVTIAIGIKSMLETRSFIVVAAAVAFGTILGEVMGVQSGVEAFAEWAKLQFGGPNPGRFAEAIVVTSLLYCVGPLTLLGCIQDAVEKKIDLIAVKSAMDGFGSIFFAATLGRGVLITAGVVLVVQGVLTLLARPLRMVARDEEVMAEATAVGGIMLMAIGLGLMEIKRLPVASFLPALALAPFMVLLGRWWSTRRTA